MRSNLKSQLDETLDLSIFQCCVWRVLDRFTVAVNVLKEMTGASRWGGAFTSQVSAGPADELQKSLPSSLQKLPSCSFPNFHEAQFATLDHLALHRFQCGCKRPKHSPALYRHPDGSVHTFPRPHKSFLKPDLLGDVKCWGWR